MNDECDIIFEISCGYWLNDFLDPLSGREAETSAFLLQIAADG